ncbi:MAG: ROK family transcriptional regulator [Chloroflexota bacterium]|nr:ROK family transcriptional regulator [Chloroflexota bacterium]
MSKTGNRELIRAINRALILNKIKVEGPISRADIARETGLSPATATGISAELLDQGLIREQSGESKGGRPPILLSLEPDGGYVIGVKIMENAIYFSLIDLEMNLISSRLVEITEYSPPSILSAIANGTQRLLQDNQISKNKLLGVGVGVAGVIEFSAGILHHSPILGWNEVPFKEMLMNRMKLPVYIDNDVNTLVVAEQVFGAGEHTRNFVVATIGRGLGLGMVLNGEIYRGVMGAGEFGHITEDSQGALCSCGKRGCLETIVSYPGMIRAYNEQVGADAQISTPEGLISLIRAGDAVALEVTRHAGEKLGQHLANLVTILAPELIILSGEGVQLGDAFFEPMQSAYEANLMPNMSYVPQFMLEDWGDEKWALGAASLVLNELYKTPNVKAAE